jgi:tetratricopeptide (TPR) repeat protein
MAKQGGDKPPARKKKAAAPAAPKLPDRRATESVLSAFGGRPRGATLDDAQDLMYRAWDTSGRKARIALARRALEISPLCADAYVLLAEESAGSLQEVAELYARGVEAGERALGRRRFKEYAGHFWGFLETRPYMRARFGLAQALWEAGERDHAIGHYREMLRLNPNDNQGIREVLAACLLIVGDDAGLAELLQQYDEDGGTALLYSRTLLAFRRGGDCAQARAHLADALETNAHVPAFITGQRKVPRAMPEYVTWGGEDEAAEYARAHAAAWNATPGATDWLVLAAPRRAPPRKGRARGTR